MSTTEQIRESVANMLLTLGEVTVESRAHCIVSYFAALACHQPEVWERFMAEQKP